LETTKALVPHLRINRRGVIVNISSTGGRITFPLGARYHGTKFAVEGLSEALHYEPATLGVRVKVMAGQAAVDLLDWRRTADDTEIFARIRAQFGLSV
jgi:short-subunit dehydrogenase